MYACVDVILWLCRCDPMVILRVEGRGSNSFQELHACMCGDGWWLFRVGGERIFPSSNMSLGRRHFNFAKK